MHTQTSLREAQESIANKPICVMADCLSLALGCRVKKNHLKSNYASVLVKPLLKSTAYPDFQSTIAQHQSLPVTSHHASRVPRLGNNPASLWVLRNCFNEAEGTLLAPALSIFEPEEMA